MNNTFYNQTIMITGASSGIGKALAIQIAQEAKCLVLVARRVDRLEELSADLKVRFPNLQTVVAPCDLGDLEAIDQMLSTLQTKGIVIDILINNAGLGKQELFETISFTDVKKMIDINVTSVCYLTRRLLPSMVQSAKGGVIFIGSGAGHAWMPGATVYVGTKHFINGFAETLRAELNNTGLTITQVCPGPVDTEFDQAAGSELKGGAPKMQRISAEQCALETIEGFKKGKALIFPGKSYRRMMFLLSLMPRYAKRIIAKSGVKKLRSKTFENTKNSIGVC